MKKLLIYILIILLASGNLYADSPAGLIASNRYIDWSNAGAGTIPTRTQCTSLGTPGQVSTFVQSVTAAQIVTALQSCAGTGQNVLLNAGTYNLTGSIFGGGTATPNNVSLVGAGPLQTLLVFQTGTYNNCSGVAPGNVPICIYNGNTNTMQFIDNYADITSGLTQGSTSIVLGTQHAGLLANLHIGSIMQITQADLTSDNGNFWQCGKIPVGTDGASPPHPNITTPGCTWGGSSNIWPGRGQFQEVKVTNIVGSTITFSPALYAPNWSLSQTPYAGWENNLPVSGFGLENLTVDTQSLGDIDSQVSMEWVINSWIKNVRFLNNTASGGSARKHVHILSSMNITVRDSYFYGSSPSNEGYGIDLSFGTDDSLIENNICHHAAACWITEGGVGNVFGYNFVTDPYYTGGLSGGVANSPNWQGCDFFHHDEGDMYNLLEGEQGVCAALDDFHGTQFATTIFRNYLNGHDPATLCPGGGTACGTGQGGSKSQFTAAITIMGYQRYANVVANVLGTSTYHTNYKQALAQVFPVNGGSGTCPAAVQTSVYQLNAADQNYEAFWSGTGCYPPSAFTPNLYLDNDNLSDSTTMYWGNYDTVNAAVQTNSTETSSTASTYPGLATPSTAWSSYRSLYLTSKPTWFGAIPWPVSGPDVTGGNVSSVGGHSYTNPAANCYFNVLGGSNTGITGVLPFDASSCYTATPAAGFVITKHGPSNI